MIAKNPRDLARAVYDLRLQYGTYQLEGRDEELYNLATMSFIRAMTRENPDEMMVDLFELLVLSYQMGYDDGTRS